MDSAASPWGQPDDSLRAQGDADIAAIGALVGDPGRCRVLLALGDGRALPASSLAAEAGVSAATASSHLSKLLGAGLLSVQRHGRNRYYRVENPKVGELIEILTQLAPTAPVRSLREGTQARMLRQARTCYDHFAGRLGVGVMASMIEHKHLVGGDGSYDPRLAVHDKPSGHGHDVDYELTDDGHAFLARLGVDLPERPVVRYCVDWSEQRHHLAGTVGRALLSRLSELNWVRRASTSRALQVTEEGRAGLSEHFGPGY